jgi:hypothetical protein
MKDTAQYMYENEVLVVASNKYYSTEQCQDARVALQKMVDDAGYDTDSNYRAYSNEDFVERHLDYLSTHKVANLAGYISNLKLMTSIKRS